MINKINWEIFKESLDYNSSIERMEEKVKNIIENKCEESVWILEHNNVYTRGISAKDNELINSQNIPVINTSRGGKITYHGPGQKIIYLMLNLNKRGKDIKKYIQNLEQWIIITLDKIGIKAYTKSGLIGVWVKHNQSEKKIAAIGVRVQKWITSHGIALNVNPNLNYFSGIIPCGIKDYTVTSIKEMGINIDNIELNNLLIKYFYTIFK